MYLQTLNVQNLDVIVLWFLVADHPLRKREIRPGTRQTLNSFFQVLSNFLLKGNFRARPRVRAKGGNTQ